MKEEEEKRTTAKRAEIEAMVDSQTPDGYLLVEGRTHAIKADYGTLIDHISSLRAVPMGSVHGGKEAEEALYAAGAASGTPSAARPHPADYLQPPQWLGKLAPGGDGVFLQVCLTLVALILATHKHPSHTHLSHTTTTTTAG
jgi:hypothetical protein